jgi:hypothetical protein
MSIKSVVVAVSLAALPLLAGCAATMGGTQTASTRSAGEPIVGPIREGRCRMNGCSWFQVQSFEVVRENEKGALLRVTQREGGSDHPNGKYPERPRASSIQWGESSTSYFFCSPRFPAIISQNESGGWEGIRLDLTMPAGVTAFVENQYRAICHPDGALDVDTAAAAARLGYTRNEGEVEFKLSRLEDVFDRAN